MSEEQRSDPSGGDANAGDADGSTDVTFVGFILSLAHTAAVHLGDIPNPVTGQPGQANLPAAQQLIDIILLLEQKTRGNLTAEERQLMEQLLYELRMRFSEVAQQAQPSRIIIP
jgi:hypothetical protein